MSNQIAVVGGGVSGLTTAVRLQQAGYSVEIITEETFETTTSAVAAAIWFPYEIQPIQLANEWSLSTFHELKQLSKLDNTGVSMVSLKLYIEKEEDAVWKEALPAGSLSTINPEELPDGIPLGYRATVPLCEPQTYLPYLRDLFYELGGTLSIQQVSDLNLLTVDFDAVINCTGLGSQTLLNDHELYPIFGQIMKVDLQEGIESTAAEMPVSDDPEEIAYVIRRSDCLVLGGTVIKGRNSMEVDNGLIIGILNRCKQLVPELGPGNIHEVVAGVRPGRTSVRLSREGRIIHNYGHGGGGFTVSWGCASQVLSLVKEICPIK